MDIDSAYKYVFDNYPGDVGRFFDPGSRLALGKGCIYADGVFALFEDASERFATAIGPVFILTHECDIEQENDRAFNDYVLVCPLMPLEVVVDELSEEMNDADLAAFLGNLGKRNVFRLTAVPAIPDHLPHGAVLYFNQISHCPVALLRDGARRICAVSSFGLRDIENQLENHLLRPKDDRLAFAET